MFAITRTVYNVCIGLFVALTTQQAAQSSPQQTTQGKPPTREGLGWLSMVLLMVLFPLLFFVCVFIPIWLGVASSQ